MPNAKLTETQKRRLSILEPRLRDAVKLRDYSKAKSAAMDIQTLLRATGHETRLMHNKNWLFEAAIEAEDYSTAEIGLKAIKDKTNTNTRVHLEATALLAICLLRQRKTAEAEPFIADALKNDTVIKTASKRAELRQHIIRRFEEEGVLGAVKNTGEDGQLDSKAVQDEAGYLLLRNTPDDELLQRIGIASPPEAAAIILKIDDFSRCLLPASEIHLLPSREDKRMQTKVGSVVFAALKRRLYSSLCDKESDIYKAWVNEGLGVVLNKVYIGAAVTTMLVNLGAGSMAIAVPIVALVLKFGIEVWCDLNKPSNVMLR